MKEKDYLAVSKNLSLSFKDLDKKRGVYMITNNVNKKSYIGKSVGLKKRFANYLDVNRLNLSKSSRIHRALLKYGFQNFSLHILELDQNDGDLLSKREDFFIRVFKPAYNIKRSGFNLDFSRWSKNGLNTNTQLVNIPLKVQNLLDKCFDPAALDWHLVEFNFDQRRAFFSFKCLGPDVWVTANSLGWEEGDISKQIGYSESKTTKRGLFVGLAVETLISIYKAIDKKSLLKFFPQEKHQFIKDSLKNKIKALKKRQMQMKTSFNELPGRG